MSGFDEGRLFFGDAGDIMEGEDIGEITEAQVQARFAKFIREYYETNELTGQHVHPYSDQLTALKDRLSVSLNDLEGFDADLARQLQEAPADYLHAFEKAAASVAKAFSRQVAPAAGGADGDAPAAREVQVFLYRDSASSTPPTMIRDLTSDLVSKVVVVRGIVIASSKPRSKATHVVIQCRQCRSTKTLACQVGAGTVTVPRVCDSGVGLPQGAEGQKCPIDPYVILPHRSRTVDQQTLKLQELPEDIRDGDLPRSIVVVVDRHLVNKVVPGTRVTIYGVYSIYTQAPAKDDRNRNATGIRQPYIRAVGIEEASEGSSRLEPRFSDEEARQFHEFAKQPDAQARLLAMMAPGIFGHEHIKKAIACLLFGGARKRLPDGVSLRGDINVLLLGDPSTAKSQFLKFVERTAPIAVYTSGKGSSAAGLTASVIRDPATREFYLEGGAMVLADGGVVCIDEFDKMRPEDRVAIHEAMEQQTISIAKAGITTVLNARAAVLAAANPPSGRYDDMRSVSDNIDLQTTILSRFDMVFLVRDERTVEKDMRIASHVLRIHSEATQGANNTGGPEEAANRAEANFLRRYIQYSKSQSNPRLSDKASERLKNQYVFYREAREKKAMAKKGDVVEGAPEIPITVRQLEALIRISEALARMTLSPEATEAHVEEAIQLFNVSTAQTAAAGLAQGMGPQSDEERRELQSIIAQVKRRIAVGHSTPYRRLLQDLVRTGLGEAAVSRAIHLMTLEGSLQSIKERKVLKRVK